MFRGSMVALATPFNDAGQVDEATLAALVAWHIAEGTHGIVPCGTTGESATLTHDEHCRVVAVAVEAASGRVPILAGTGSNSTSEAIELTRQAKAAGADGALLITPYYNKPTQAGLVAHFTAIAEAVDIPQMLYNVPSRTVANLLPESVAKLARLANIVAIKEATGSMAVAGDILHRCGDQLDVISGDDFANLGLLAMGAVGAISVTANVAPRQMADMFNAWQSGDLDRARAIHMSLIPLHEAMFFETSPIPVKTALGLMGKINPNLRLPLSAIGSDARQRLTSVLTTAGLVQEQPA